MEKQLKLTQIKGKFLKDFDTFGKMDPFITVSIGKSQGKTETAQGGGKQPSWNQSIILTYLDQTSMVVKAFDEDATQNQYIGESTIDIKNLKPSGNIQIKLESKGQSVATITCKYTLTNLPPTPFLFIKNIKCDFYKQTKLILKAKPYFSVTCGDQNMVTEVKTDGDGKFLQWAQNIRIKVKDGQNITFNVLDKDANGGKIFGCDANISQFKTINGHKKYYVNDQNYQPLGILQFDYETLNLVTKEESAKNQDKFKQDQNNMTKITIEKIRAQLGRDDMDAFFKIIIGPNMTKTKIIESAKRNFICEEKVPFYAQSKQNAIIFSLWDHNRLMDENIGNGTFSLPASSGEKKIQIKDSQGIHCGNLYVTITAEKIVCKSILINEIKVKLDSTSDLIGQSDPYVVGRIGGWSCRTQTGDGNQYSFKKALDLRFSSEEKVIFQIWDEDVTTDEKAFQEQWNLKDIKDRKGQMNLKLRNEKGEVKGQLFFKFQAKNVKIETVPVKNDKKKQSQKDLNKIDPKKQQVKKQQPKKQQVKIQQPKKQQVKKQQPKKQQVKKQQKKKQLQNEKSPQKSITYLQKSKNTVLKLPHLHNYGDSIHFYYLEIFDKQSATTLQKSIHSYSMPKAQRFTTNQAKYAGEPSYYVDTCFKTNSQKGAGFGYGNKKQFPDWMEKNMKQNPAPGAYFEQHGIKSDSFRVKGPTFGISHKYYEKVIIPTQPKTLTPKQKLKPLRENKIE